MTKLTAKQAMKKAVSYNGYQEGDNNDNKFTVGIGFPNHIAWCQGFCGYVLKNSDVDYPKTCYTPTAEGWYKKQGRLSKTPHVGDQFFVYYPHLDGGRVGHTGFVIGISADRRTVYTIEGNSNKAGSRDSKWVTKRARPVLAAPGTKGIRSYGSPDYAKEEAKPREKKPAPKISVKALQRAVHTTPDGEWGPITNRALANVRSVALVHGSMKGRGASFTRTLQGNIGTKVDGIWGPKSKLAFRRTVAKIQVALHVAPDSVWGPITDHAYSVARKEYYRP